MSESIEQVRDRVRDLLGWKFQYPTWRGTRMYARGTQLCESDPVPLTIDGIANLLPKGWRWEMIEQRPGGSWSAFASPGAASKGGAGTLCQQGHGPTEYEARLRLLLAILSANDRRSKREQTHDGPRVDSEVERPQPRP